MLRAPFTLTRHAALPLPVMVSVPHAGRDYPVEAAHMLRVPLHQVMKLEDRHADLLVADAMSAGAQAIIAKTPRLWIDLNRAENDIDPQMVRGALPIAAPVSAKARGGLGLVPRRLADVGDIWATRLTAQDILQRITTCHQPYHMALSGLLTELRDIHGAAVLLDVHSMPPLNKGHNPQAAQIVLGDKFGRSAGQGLTARLAGLFEAAGLRVAINAPYPGNYMLERHGRPRHGIHAIQIEVDRQLYLDEWLAEPGPGLPAMQALLGDAARALADHLNCRPLAVAAE